MQRITSTEFQRQFGEALATAKHEPVTITTRGRADLVVLDFAEYTRLKQLDKREHLFASDLSEEDIEAIQGESIDHLPE